MRKVYILPDEGVDDQVLEALEAAGQSVRHEGDLQNPLCPICGGDTLLAYSEGNYFEVLTWSSLEDYEGETDNADGWYLVCQRLECHWEEPVERSLKPLGATIFDMEQAHYGLDDYCGLHTRCPFEMKELIGELQRHLAARPSRKVESFLEEAEFQYEYHMADIRQWLASVPAGREIEFVLEGDRVKGRLVAATDEGLLLTRTATGEMLAVRAEALQYYTPKSFPDEPEAGEPEAEPPFRHPDQWVLLVGVREMVVVRGFHLELVMTDRLGQYHAGTRDKQVAEALGLPHAGGSWWEGPFRRAELEARYDRYHMLKVCGHWVEQYGETRQSRFPAVKTKDPAIAAELGLKPQYSGPPGAGPEGERAVDHYSGIILRELVEAERDDCVYLWPEPETASPPEQ